MDRDLNKTITISEYDFLEAVAKEADENADKIHISLMIVAIGAKLACRLFGGDEEGTA